MKIKVYMKEIQYRLFFTSFSFLLNATTIYYFKDQLVFLLGQHQNNTFPHFITTNLPEVFLCFLKLSFFIGLYCTFPVVIIQFWFFMRPALYRYEYKKGKNVITLLIGLFLISTYFVYDIALPYSWKFFSTFELNYENNGVNLQLETRLQEYLNLIIRLLSSLIAIVNFSASLSLFLLKFPLGTLTKLRRVIYLMCFILSTILTPPDVLSQIFTGLVLITLYELFMFSLFLTNQYRKGE